MRMLRTALTVCARDRHKGVYAQSGYGTDYSRYLSLHPTPAPLDVAADHKRAKLGGGVLILRGDIGR